MISYTTISSEDEGTINDRHYEIVSLLDDNEDFYYATCLEIKTGTKLIECWDNTEYLVDILYPYLCDETEDEDLETIIGPDKTTIKTLMDEAIKKGFFKNIRRN